MSLSTVPLSPPVVVNYADGRSMITSHNVTVDQAVGSLQFQVLCTPTVLAHYDVVLGKPRLTSFNPEINWKLDTVVLHYSNSLHVLVGAPRSDVPEYVISAVRAERLVRKGNACYIVKINLLNACQVLTAATSPELDDLLREFEDVLSGLPEGLPSFST